LSKTRQDSAGGDSDPICENSDLFHVQSSNTGRGVHALSCQANQGRCQALFSRMKCKSALVGFIDQWKAYGRNDITLRAKKAVLLRPFPCEHCPLTACARKFRYYLDERFYRIKSSSNPPPPPPPPLFVKQRLLLHRTLLPGQLPLQYQRPTVPPAGANITSFGVTPSAVPPAAAAAAASRTGRSGTSTVDQYRVVTSPATNASLITKCKYAFMTKTSAAAAHFTSARPVNALRSISTRCLLK